MAEKTFTKSKRDERYVSKAVDLIHAIEKVYPSTKVLMWRSFLQGLFVALGTTVGLSIVLTIVTFVISQLKGVPFMDQVIKSTQIENVINPK